MYIVYLQTFYNWGGIEQHYGQTKSTFHVFLDIFCVLFLDKNIASISLISASLNSTLTFSETCCVK